MNAHQEDSDWLYNEFRGLDLGDPRLLERFFTTAQLLAAKPSDCILKACGSWSAAKGAYRLFSNDRLSPNDMFSCHQAETVGRISEHKLVFAIQDSSFLDYHTHKRTDGLGAISRPYGDKYKRGLIIHPTYVVTEKAVPLGLVTWASWARPSRPTRTRYETTLDNFLRETKDKESNKWLASLREMHELLPKDTKVVTLADREADIYEFMQEHLRLGRSFVIRNRTNRRLDRAKYTKPKMHDVIKRQKPCGHHEIEVPAQPGKKSRKALLAIRYLMFTTPLRSNVKGGISKNREGLPATVSFNLVYACEVNPPSSDERIEWYLMTNEPVTGFEQAVEKVNWYKLRWQIETFFRTLKSGCRIEETRLGAVERLKKYNVLMAVIAWRISYLTHFSRHQGHEPCTKLLDDTQWKVLYFRMKQTNKLPKRPPSCEEVVSWIAQLGGFLNRKGDGLPGPKSLWRGWQALEEMVPLYFILAPALAP